MNRLKVAVIREIHLREAIVAELKTLISKHELAFDASTQKKIGEEKRRQLTRNWRRNMNEFCDKTLNDMLYGKLTPSTFDSIMGQIKAQMV